MKKRASNKDILVFAIWFIAIFAVSYGGLYFLGLVPKELDQNGRETVLDRIQQGVIESVSTNTQVEPEEIGDIPIRLQIPDAKIDILVQNPQTTNPALLDEKLKNGIIRYPGSGLLGVAGNVLLFGHSSNWAVVKNPNYKALNGIEKLKPESLVYLKGEDSADHVYVYKVRSVRMAPASDILVDFSKKEKLLTISTCNTFGAKEDRYVMEAVFVGKEIK